MISTIKYQKIKFALRLNLYDRLKKKFFNNNAYLDFYKNIDL